MFTSDVYFDVICRGEAPSRMRTNTVRFAPGARTAGHCHAVGQTLYVTREAPEEGVTESEWRDHVTDEEYGE